MRVRFTSIVWEETGDLANAALDALRTRVAARLEGESYGADVSAFMGVLVAVSDEDNSRFARPYNTVRYETDGAGDRFKQITLAFELSPGELEGRDEAEISDLAARALSRRLMEPAIKLPRGFEWRRFSDDLTKSLNLRP